MRRTSRRGVAGLAKPVIDIDIDLTVADAADEAAYLPDLEPCGFTLTVREREQEEHRMLTYAAPPATRPTRTTRSPVLGD